MLAGYPPFYGNSEVELHQKTLRGEYKFFIDDWSEINPMAMDLISAMLNVNPDDRITMNGILKHEWMKTPLSKEPMKQTLNRLKTFNSQRKVKTELIKATRAEAGAARTGKNANGFLSGGNNNKYTKRTTTLNYQSTTSGNPFKGSNSKLSTTTPIFSKHDIAGIRKARKL